MKKFEAFSGKAIPLPLKDVDTDMILPAQHLTNISRDGFGQHLFSALRSQIADFPFNQPCYDGRSILIADSNFGCGSSREHAVWALTGSGIRVIISKSFADIFSSNSAKNGLLLVTLEPAIVDELLQSAGGGSLELAVDLAAQTVQIAGGRTVHFEYDQFRKHCLLNGLEDMDYILSHGEEIARYWSSAAPRSFVSTLRPNNS